MTAFWVQLIWTKIHAFPLYIKTHITLKCTWHTCQPLLIFVPSVIMLVGPSPLFPSLLTTLAIPLLNIFGRDGKDHGRLFHKDFVLRILKYMEWTRSYDFKAYSSQQNGKLILGNNQKKSVQQISDSWVAQLSGNEHPFIQYARPRLSWKLMKQRCLKIVSLLHEIKGLWV